MVLGIPNTLAKYGALAAGLILFGLFINRSREVGIGGASQEIASSIGTFGKGIGAVGGGIADLGRGIGTGTAKLFDPLFTLRDLIFPPEAGNQPAPTAATQGQTPLITPAETSPAPIIPTVTPPPVTVTTGQQLTTEQATYLVRTGQVTAARGSAAVLQRAVVGTPTILRGETLQLYANQRSQLVAVRPSSAVKLRQRGYL